MTIDLRTCVNDAGHYISASTLHNLDITEILPMTTDHKIPQRTTLEFTRYAADVMFAYLEGKEIEHSNAGFNSFHKIDIPPWQWDYYDYRIKPEKTWRWYTAEEFYALVPTHGCFLIRKIGHQTIHIAEVVCDCLFSSIGYTVGKTNFTEYEKSIDGGKSWQRFGVES